MNDDKSNHSSFIVPLAEFRGDRSDQRWSNGLLAANVDCVAFKHTNKETTMFASRSARWVLGSRVAGLLAVVLFGHGPSLGQDAAKCKGKQPAFITAGYEDCQDMR